jgi:hypothetical protein
MRLLVKLSIPLALALSGCVVVPVGPPRAYVRGPGVAILAPAPFVVVHPYYRRRWW